MHPTAPAADTEQSTDSYGSRAAPVLAPRLPPDQAFSAVCRCRYRTKHRQPGALNASYGSRCRYRTKHRQPGALNAPYGSRAAPVLAPRLPPDQAFSAVCHCRYRTKNRQPGALNAPYGSLPLLRQASHRLKSGLLDIHIRFFKLSAAASAPVVLCLFVLSTTACCSGVA
jgi:hypothetical protein